MRCEVFQEFALAYSQHFLFTFLFYFSPLRVLVKFFESATLVLRWCLLVRSGLRVEGGVLLLNLLVVLSGDLALDLWVFALLVKSLECFHGTCVLWEFFNGLQVVLLALLILLFSRLWEKGFEDVLSLLIRINFWRESARLGHLLLLHWLGSFNE